MKLVGIYCLFLDFCDGQEEIHWPILSFGLGDLVNPVINILLLFQLVYILGSVPFNNSSVVANYLACVPALPWKLK